MDHYMDIRLRPDPELSPSHLMNALFNKLHREGSNLATASGQLAAMAVIHAKRKGDYSARTLSIYKDLMEKSYVLNDLKKYGGLPKFLSVHHDMFSVYPEMLSEAAEKLLIVDGKTKHQVMKSIVWGTFLKKRPVWKLARDVFDGWRAM